jgi:hypothetical protein
MAKTIVGADLEKLYRAFRTVEQVGQPTDYIRFLIAFVNALAFRMDADKRHQRPHIHIDYGSERRMASYAIDDGTRLAGDLERKYDRVVKAWIKRRKTLLLELWNTVQAGKDRMPILAKIQHVEYG